jgi:DNA repair protein RadC
MYKKSQQLKMFIREIPKSETLNVRIKNGLTSLKTSELIALITRDKEPDALATEKAEQLLILIQDDLSKLNTISKSDFKNIGYTERQVGRLLTALELSNRSTYQDKETITSPADVYDLMKKHIAGLEVEHFFIILLNTKNQLIKTEVVSKGILDASIVHPREVFKSAIRNNASSIILCHNHPSCIVKPSAEDITITKTLSDAGIIIGISILDHIIIASNGDFLSLKEKNIFS